MSTDQMTATEETVRRSEFPREGTPQHAGLRGGGQGHPGGRSEGTAWARVLTVLLTGRTSKEAKQADRFRIGQLESCQEELPLLACFLDLD